MDWKRKLVQFLFVKHKMLTTVFICIILAVIGIGLTKLIVCSDLPLWLKFYLLS